MVCVSTNECPWAVGDQKERMAERKLIFFKLEANYNIVVVFAIH